MGKQEGGPREGVRGEGGGGREGGGGGGGEAGMHSSRDLHA